MALVRGKNTKPEIAVRDVIESCGLKYSLHDNTLPGCPDVIFRARKKVIFVHGCFWHQHGSRSCWRSRVPKSRPDFWIPKLTSNVLRDKSNIKALQKAGWKVLVIWECETIVTKRTNLKSRIRRFVAAPHLTRRSS
jgi:DNA mismatch endonuclease (patch repair protein)